MGSERKGFEALERAIGRLRRREPAPPADDEPLATLSGAAFRATVTERLRGLERQIDEVKGRVNGLIFLLAGTVAAQLLIRLLE
jgi:hypothetical protein